ncbi:MAG: putative metal-binding motif-containing protein [Flavobacteriales bacterium]|nr:putative metal-binding motif-containing protein [Flavobacteriales bacterium]
MPSNATPRRADALVQFIACNRLTDANNDGYFAPADCNDQNQAIFPGAVEVCDGADNDCDGQLDEAGGAFADNDGDGFGNPSVILACGVPGVANNLDCNDNNAQQYPGGPLPCPDCAPADQALILSDPDIFATASGCFGPCFGQGANATNCTSICLEGELSIGADCADCVAQYIVCVYSTCTPCLINPNSAACLQCRNIHRATRLMRTAPG